MAVRRSGNKLEVWEVALVKALLDDERWQNDQDILAFFTRPTRSINHRVIGEIRSGKKHSTIEAATQSELQAFLLNWPDLDPATGLSTRGDELLIKARESMIAAVNIFNSAGLTFRSELFIVSAMIAWTYLLHAWYKQKGIDFRYKPKSGNQANFASTTPGGAERFWDLSYCIKHKKCPLSRGVVNNIRILLDIRHEIEHRLTNRIDSVLSSKLQACCINFNTAIKDLFGGQYSLESQLAIALQFVTFDLDQQVELRRAQNLPRHIQTLIGSFEAGLTQQQLDDPSYAYRVYLVPKTANSPNKADLAVEIVAPGSEVAEKFAVALKEVEKRKYTPSQIVKTMQSEGFSKFTMRSHILFWKGANAKDPKKGYGVTVVKTWYWYDSWLIVVRHECEENKAQYA